MADLVVLTRLNLWMLMWLKLVVLTRLHRVRCRTLMQ
jgi:hypothetical protein